MSPLIPQSGHHDHRDAIDDVDNRDRAVRDTRHHDSVNVRVRHGIEQCRTKCGEEHGVNVDLLHNKYLPER